MPANEPILRPAGRHMEFEVEFSLPKSGEFIQEAVANQLDKLRLQAVRHLDKRARLLQRRDRKPHEQIDEPSGRIHFRIRVVLSCYGLPNRTPETAKEASE